MLITAVLISRRCGAAVRDQSAELPVNHRFPGPLPGMMTLGMPRRLPIQAAQSRTGAPSARPTTTLRIACVGTTDTNCVCSLVEGLVCGGTRVPSLSVTLLQGSANYEVGNETSSRAAGAQLSYRCRSKLLGARLASFLRLGRALLVRS